jgi:hypothetical protein
MTWNHRIIRRNGRDLAIHEVYYNEAGDPDMVTNDATGIYGETIDELRETLQRMLRALDTPILEYESFEQNQNELGIK